MDLNKQHELERIVLPKTLKRKLGIDAKDKVDVKIECNNDKDVTLRINRN